MTFPTLKDWLFSAKSFAAAALALAVAFRMDLAHPYWAVATVYITTQSSAGATQAKAIWRLAGTLAGGVFTVAVLPNLVNAPLMLSLAFALWISLCLTLSLLDPTPRAYAFMLAGYTAAMIGFPSVDAPGGIFDTAVARCEEIGLGILCAWLVHGVLFPLPSVPLLQAKLTTWLEDVARFGATSLQGRLGEDAFASERRRMARDGAALNALFQPARYELSGKAALLWLPVLHEQARQVPALITFIADRATALHTEDPQAHAAMRPLLADIAQWLADTARLAQAGAADLTARRLLDQIGRAGEAARSRASWAGVLQEGLAERLTELVNSWRACVTLSVRMLATEQTDALPPAPAIRSPGHTDPLLLALTGTATALSTLIGCAFWINTGWSGGASMPLMAAVVTCVFAQLDDPAPALMKFLFGAVLALSIAGLLLFAVLPAIDGLPLLLLVFAVLYLPIGAFQTVPAFASVAAAVTFFLPSMLGLEETYRADFVHFADSGAATLMGVTLALAVTRLVRSVGLAWRVQRLVEADRRDLLGLIEGKPGELRRIIAVMLDRFEALAARLGAVDGSEVGVVELADLRASLNVLRLREQVGSLAPGLQQLMTTALYAIGAELRGRGNATDTLTRIDSALAVAMAGPDRPARKAALSLAGLRLALFPAAQPPVPPLPFAEAIGSLAG
ncbi:MAG TPA: FUSC family protein [Dongiaceae bacterium]|nr:FUSC family protein [Dongiaceae bacterium]